MTYKHTGLPPKQGLYDPQFEHDACGIGCVVNINGEKTHLIIKQALTILANLAHRGGAGSEDNTGDGAGILVQIPDRFFRKMCPSNEITLPGQGEYGVGMVFLPRDLENRIASESIIETAVKAEGQKILGWRTVPINESTLGSIARSNRPYIRQIFIGKSSEAMSELDFERRLYVIRKRCEQMIVDIPESSENYFYFASLSSRTIVYKGMLTAEQVEEFYLELTSMDFDSSLALVHSRYSTNTFPSWERAHPYRYLIHNGEINTLRGNINWMHARQSGIRTDLYGDDIGKIFPVINPNGSDSAMFDNCLEFLTLSGRSLPHVAMMMVPEPWNNHESMSESRKAFYEYHNILMEPWDGPAAMAFTDGKIVAATLDRNGLRPSRYYITTEGQLILASEAGVLDIPADRIASKERLRPGRMLIIDTEAGRIINDDEIKEAIAAEKPYKEWLDENMVHIDDLPESQAPSHAPTVDLELAEKLFGYNYEDLKTVLIPMAITAQEPLSAMGTDIPLAVLSDKPQLLFNYFKQLFAQVTNPPIDAIREQLVTSTETYIGSDGNLIAPGPKDCIQIKLTYPIITNRQIEKLRRIERTPFSAVTLDIMYDVKGGGKALEEAMENLYARADEAIADGYNLIILSDRHYSESMAPIPSLLAVSGLHHHLILTETRTHVSLIVESGEPREVHHLALLLGYGASAINPYLAFEAVDGMIDSGILKGVSKYDAHKNYIKASIKGIIKVISKMGISTILSYRASQIFEALGISQDVVDRYFTATATRIGGIGLDIIAGETALRHEAAFDMNNVSPGLESGGFYRWRSNGEYHQFNPLSVYKLQQSVRTGDYSIFKSYSALLNEENQKLCTLRGLLRFKGQNPSVPIEEVEPVSSIVKRFKTGAMSYGSISQEAHEALAIAMNRLGGRSNTGEGGEDPERFIPMENGDSRNSAIKQVASGRFGVTSEYLVNAKELQIKMAQGAKPGEGGQLPGAKVYPWVARTRHSTPGVGLISPPPHHDIYSIEDLAELIFDLKNANTDARISVKLVSEVGVGTVAAGVAKGLADVVLISGYDGGTGASPVTSIRHAGLPWELGLAETHQTLMLNDLRSRIVVETDGKLMTGRDVVIAALLGAEEFGFATAPLVALGCVMMRVCNLDTCPVGVATQNPELRRRFAGKPEYVVNFMQFIAQEMRELMAMLGFRTIDEMVGRTDVLEADSAIDHWKASGVDLSCLLYQPVKDADAPRRMLVSQDHGIDKTMDKKLLIPLCTPSLRNGTPVRLSLPIRNVNRVTGTQLGSEITRKYGAAGLPEDTVSLHFRGSAGQSFGAFIPPGITLELEGDSNDYMGKGLSGGKIIVRPDRKSTFTATENIIAGNVALYGATSGEAYIYGMAGERFAVRNSGARAVVESVGDHGCEYMTGGVVVVLGPTGRNFAAGMSGGIALVLDEKGDFAVRCNKEMVYLQQIESKEDSDLLKEMITKHFQYTGSIKAKQVLDNFDDMVGRFVKVMPIDYAVMLEAIDKVRSDGVPEDQVMLAAFELGIRKAATA
ncbi:MAG: glutamate synthase large subunit [Saccharofermentanales bacterium]